MIHDTSAHQRSAALWLPFAQHSQFYTFILYLDLVPIIFCSHSTHLPNLLPLTHRPKAVPRLQSLSVLSFDALKMLSWSQWMWVTAPLCPSSVRQRSVRTSHARTVQSAEALTTQSGLARFVTYTAPRCPSSSETHFFRVQSHSLTFPSAPPDASNGPVTLPRSVF